MEFSRLGWIRQARPRSVNARLKNRCHGGRTSHLGYDPAHLFSPHVVTHFREIWGRAMTDLALPGSIEPVADRITRLRAASCNALAPCRPLMRWKEAAS
jgi:hypothetical protein